MPAPSPFPSNYGTRENYKRIDEILHSGYVVDQDFTTLRVRVSYPDRNFVSSWMKVLQRSCLGAQDGHLPRLGEFVHVLHTPNGLDTGLVLGATYTDNNPVPPMTTQNARYLRMDDGTTIEVNGGKVFVNAAGPIEMHAAGPISFIVTGYALIQCANAKIDAANTEITGNTKIDGALTVLGGMNISGGTTTATITGNIVQTGNLTITGSAGINTRFSNGDGSGGGS